MFKLTGVALAAGLCASAAQTSTVVEGFYDGFPELFFRGIDGNMDGFVAGGELLAFRSRGISGVGSPSPINFNANSATSFLVEIATGEASQLSVLGQTVGFDFFTMRNTAIDTIIPISNVTFDIVIASDPSTVPLPAGAALGLAGLGALGAVRRLRG